MPEQSAAIFCSAYDKHTTACQVNVVEFLLGQILTPTERNTNEEIDILLSFLYTIQDVGIRKSAGATCSNNLSPLQFEKHAIPSFVTFVLTNLILPQ